MVHSLSIPLFLSQFLPHSGSSLSPHKTVHSLQLLTGFHLSLSYPACPIALSKLRLHGHIFSSLRSHPLPLCKAYIRNPLLYLLMNAVASRSVSGSFQFPLTEASPSPAALCSAHLKRGNAYLRSIFSSRAWSPTFYCKLFRHCNKYESSFFSCLPRIKNASLSYRIHHTCQHISPGCSQNRPDFPL